MNAALSANHILDFSQQAARSTAPVDTLSTLYNPVDLKLKASAGLSAGGLSANLSVNYADGYRTDDTPSARDVGAWTTVDLNLSMEFGASDWKLLEDVSVSLNVLNLFDTPPPATPTNAGFRLAGYDPTNASPLGRFLAVELRKTF